VLQGRLENGVGPSLEDTLDNIRAVKDTVRRDAVNPETTRPFFDPTLMKRSNLWPQKNVFNMTPASNEETDTARVQLLRRAFKEQVLKHDFQDRQEENLTELLVYISVHIFFT